MKNPTPTPITRVSLAATACYNARWFAGLLAGSTVLGSSISQAAVNSEWIGGDPAGPTNWNIDANWTLGVPVRTGVDPTNENALINIVAGPVLTLANGAPPSAILAIPTDIIIGSGSLKNGRLDHISGDASTGSGNFLYAGLGAGTGVYNLADTGVVVGPGLNNTGYGPGTGNMNVQGQFRIGDGAGSNGTANINTSGTLTVASGIQVATNSATGRVNIDAGTINATAGWCEIGNGGGCNGKLFMSGGTLTKAGANDSSGFIIGANGATGEATIGGNAIINVTVGGNDNGAFRVGNNGGSKGTLNLSGTASITVNNQFYVGNNTGTGVGAGGTLNMTGGSINVNNWTAIGRSGGTGTVNMSGGTWTKTGGGTQFIVGSSGPATMNMTGGLVDIQGGFTWVGEGSGASPAVLTISGATTYPAGPEYRSPYISVGPESPNATLNLDGGTVRTHRFGGKRNENDGANSGNGTIKFNGSRIIATANDAAFINDVNTVQINAGGMLIDTNNFTLSTGHTIGGTGGGVTKLGAGSLTLSGTTTFNGNNTVNAGTLAFTGTNALPGTNTVNAGKLAVTTAATGSGNYVVANGGTLGITQTGPAVSLVATNTTLGTSAATTLDIDLGNHAGLPTAPVLATTGLTVGGPVSINLVDTAPVVGSVPLISYVGPKGGSGSFNTVLGSVPVGVIATVVDNGTNLVSLDVTRVNSPYWKGEGNGVWLSEADAVTPDGDWFEDYTEVTKNFQNGDPALFDDRVVGTSEVLLNSTVLPGGSGVRFDNANTYGLSGSGKISGSTTLTKTNSGTVVIATENDYTGTTTLSGGSVSVAKLASSASPTAPLGKGSLVLAGGTLDYTGAGQVTDQGFSITGTGGIALAADVEFQGAITSTGGKLVKSGVGNLTLSFNGANVIGGGGQDSEIQEGDLILTGGGAQTVSIPGSLYVSTVFNGLADLSLSNTAVTIGNFIAIGRGNGDDGVSNLTVTNSTLNVGGFSTGFANGNTNNLSEQFVTVNNSTITSGGVTYLGESQGSTTTMTMSNNSQYNAGGVFILGRLGSTSTGNLTLSDSSKVIKTAGAGSHVAIGGEGAGTLTMNGTSQFTTPGGDFNVGDVGSAVGLLDINADATVTLASNVFIGKNSSKGTIDMSGTSNMSTTGFTQVSGGGATSEGTLTVAGSAEYLSTNQFLVGFGAASKGFVTVDGSGKIQVNSFVSVGFNGTGTMTVKGDGSFANNDDFSVNENGDAPVTVTVQDTGSLTVGGNLYVGRNGGRVGTLTVSGTGGEVNQTNAAAAFNVGQSGNGTLNIQGSATVTAASNNGVVLGQIGDGTGTVNLDGGTLTAKRIFGNAGNSTFNFNGGLLRAATGATPAFMSGVDNSFVKAGGALIDSNGEAVTISVPLLTDPVSTGGGLTKSGAGTLVLSGANTYTGTTTVTAGTLSLSTATLANTSVVDVSATGSAILNLNFAGSDVVAGFSIDGVPQATGTWGAPGSGATNVTARITGTGILNVGGVDSFADWIDDFAVGGLTGKTDDFDKDGLTNLEEFALDGNPSTGASTGKVRSRIELVGAEQALVITLPVRVGATFDNTPGPGADATVVADDVVYLIRGSNDLLSYNQIVTEIPVSAANPTMPALSDPSKWEYRTFRLSGVVPARGPRGFLDIEIQDAP
ncbi:autotransporter-associated beta strand repeat-containing protein [Luteolibacter arcticus]|uniref:Autotransporter-associated beta strand repeat-containing protein n=1 Tax=Luteolibacter arcticus TaxID=1581411 RepID=A0ABT3GJT3_9BACT|nr:autotransporter-associated beta strand repeat-containing protein [Luteolibacter arcticus]MCW1923769.1 autotransporter-associated beta strand repeat-containing protein [Luteolibacter arcticus]